LFPLTVLMLNVSTSSPGGGSSAKYIDQLTT
jgi:hypothetical protein